MRLIVPIAVVLILLLQPLQAQIRLKPMDGVEGRYLIEFVSEETAVPTSSSDIRSMRATQRMHLTRLGKDLYDTDLVIRHDLWLRQAAAITLSPRFLERLERLNYVARIRPESRFRAESQGVVELPLSKTLAQQHLERIDVDGLWAEGYLGQGVVVAILDSGVDRLHQDLALRWRGGSNSWFDPYGEQAEPLDLTGHGTSVASLVLGGDATGSAIGVAPNAQWIAARVFDNSGVSSEGAISEALQWLLDPDGDPDTADYPHIVQNSWGLAGTEGSCNNPFAIELAALDALGVLQVFAVGNSGSAGASSYLTPAFDPHVIPVGAVQADDEIWYESSRGPDLCGHAQIPALVAPGERIKAANLTFNGFDTDNASLVDGTSFSSPQVSGALALLVSKYRLKTPKEAVAALKTAALDLGGTGADPDYGYGLLRVSAANQLLAEAGVDLKEGGIRFSRAAYRLLESAGHVSVVLVRTGRIDDPAVVSLLARDGEAELGKDYDLPSPQQVEFAPGEYRKTIAVNLIDDVQTEGIEHFELVLSDNGGVNLGEPSRITVSLLDDEGAGDAEEEIGGASLDPVMLLSLVGLLACGRRRG